MGLTLKPNTVMVYMNQMENQNRLHDGLFLTGEPVFAILFVQSHLPFSKALCFSTELLMLFQNRDAVI